MKRILWILGVLAAVFLFGWGYRQGRKSVKLPQPDTVRLADTCWLESPVIEKEIPVPVPADVDTAAILKAYFTKRVYHDEVVSTPQITVTIVDTVYRNVLLGRTAMYDVKIPVHDRCLALGMTIAPQTFCLLAGYRHKRAEFMGGYDFANKMPVVGVKYDLWKW